MTEETRGGEKGERHMTSDVPNKIEGLIAIHHSIAIPDIRKIEDMKYLSYFVTGKWPIISMLAMTGAPVCLQQPLAAQTASTELAIHSDFPGGSVAVENINQATKTLRVKPVSHQKRGFDCWWYFKIEGMTPGETLTLDVGGGVWALPDQCFFSLDNKTWLQTAKGVPGQEKGRRIYQQQIDAETAWFAWGPPFVPADADQLVHEIAAKYPWATAFELCTTRAGRKVPALRVKEPGTDDDQRFGIWVQARQHAWEAGSSWVCKGFVEWLASDDPGAIQLRQSCEIVIVLVMDIDNVAVGAGGKNELPQDHNRDWSDQPHWRSVEAAQQEILKMAGEHRFDIFMDLHNPGAGERYSYFNTGPLHLLTDSGKRTLDDFFVSARTEMTAPLEFRGKVVESGPKYDKNWESIAKTWIIKRCGPQTVSVTLETAWNTPESTPSGYQHVGHGLGRAMAHFLENRNTIAE